MSTHYDVLQVDASASYSDIRKRYQELVLVLHPDRGGDEAAFRRCQEAWEVLRDEHRRRAYDAMLHGEQRAAQTALDNVWCEVDLDDMAFDAQRQCYTYTCRCGDAFVVPESDLERSLEVFACASCSLRIRVLYLPADGGPPR